MTIERYRERIHTTVVENAPVIMRKAVETQVPGLLAFSLDLLLETFEKDCPDLLQRIEDDPSSYPDLWEKLQSARNARRNT